MTENSSVSLSVATDRKPLIDGKSASQLSRGVEWYTPPGIFDALALKFDLDPCTVPGGLPWIPAATSYAPPQDGLALPWRGRVWLNPPYGSRNHEWVAKLAAHGQGIALVFARTDSSWWQRAAQTATVVCFLSRRLVFVDRDARPADNNGGSPSTLLAWGVECASATLRSGLGLCFTRAD